MGSFLNAFGGKRCFQAPGKSKTTNDQNIATKRHKKHKTEKNIKDARRGTLEVEGSEFITA